MHGVKSGGQEELRWGDRGLGLAGKGGSPRPLYRWGGSDQPSV